MRDKAEMGTARVHGMGMCYLAVPAVQVQTARRKPDDAVLAKTEEKEKMSCKYQTVCEEVYSDRAGAEMRKDCDPEHCEHWDNFFYGECLALESDGE